jgi:hypothetical protein
MNAPRCEVAAIADTTSWVTALPGDTTLSFRLPAVFKRDSSWTSFHGGALWRADGLEFQIENGYWGPASLRNSQVKSCRVSVHAGDYILDEVKIGPAYDWGAFPADTVWAITVRLALHSPHAADKAVFLAALATLHWRK